MSAGSEVRENALVGSDDGEEWNVLAKNAADDWAVVNQADFTRDSQAPEKLELEETDSSWLSDKMKDIDLSAVAPPPDALPHRSMMPTEIEHPMCSPPSLSLNISRPMCVTWAELERQPSIKWWPSTALVPPRLHGNDGNRQYMFTGDERFPQRIDLFIHHGRSAMGAYSVHPFTDFESTIADSVIRQLGNRCEKKHSAVVGVGLGEQMLDLEAVVRESRIHLNWEVSTTDLVGFNKFDGGCRALMDFLKSVTSSVEPLILGSIEVSESGHVRLFRDCKVMSHPLYVKVTIDEPIRGSLTNQINCNFESPPISPRSCLIQLSTMLDKGDVRSALKVWTHLLLRDDATDESRRDCHILALNLTLTHLEMVLGPDRIQLYRDELANQPGPLQQLTVCRRALFNAMWERGRGWAAGDRYPDFN
eukprot:GHVN01056140.1.p1 GENE.GHVN01056140.1~~GHVN01056140.1.p1  ORF type:complete len:420 (+),score=57.90 GHVN01056140.1:1821-3080(+)